MATRPLDNEKERGMNIREILSHDVLRVSPKSKLVIEIFSRLDLKMESEVYSCHSCCGRLHVKNAADATSLIL